MDQALKFGGALVAAATMLLGIGRYVGQMEQRMQQLESKQEYYHGQWEVPPPAMAKE